MPTSLQSIVQNQKYALQTIPLASSTPIGKEIVWIIVEDQDDKEIYSKFFTKDCYIFNSQISNSNTSRGCKNVEDIVSAILNIDHSIHIFGIRDRDYTIFDPNYIIPSNVFYTDSRDIEMMMYECDDVQVFLRQSYSNFDSFYTTTLTYSREIGYLRIFNDVNQIDFNFKRNFKFDFLAIPNFTPTQLRSSLIQTIQNQSNGFIEQDYLNFIYNICSYSDSLISRGHDVVKILITLIRNNTRRNINKKVFCIDLKDHYSSSSFFSSHLFQNIRTFCENIQKEIW
jgi:hypothetical protein